MKKLNNQTFAFICLAVLLSACGKGSTGKVDQSVVANLPNGSSLPEVTGNNVMKMTVNGDLCGAGTDAYPNKPCVAVTICNLDGSSCTTVNDILLDTGSYGLRIFKSVLPHLNYTPLTSKQGGELAECAKFGDGSSQWGPVVKASVVLAGEDPIQVPMQIIDSSYGKPPSNCADVDASPDKTGFNGVLGVGLLAADCGSACLGDHTGNGTYFSCSGSGDALTCVGGTTSTLADQVQNPVTLLPTDNNGLIVQLPSIALGGAPTVNGYVVLGIGTQSNNTAGKVTKYSADDLLGEFVATVGGVTHQSFIDSGSNAIFFPASDNLPLCDPDNSPWYCPDTTVSLSATITSSDGANKVNVNYYVGNALGLFGDNNAFQELGGQGSSEVNWGMPFFYGRNVYIGIEGKKSSLGSGPYWAF